MENLGMQRTTHVSCKNIEMEANRPINAPYRAAWPRGGWMSQMYLNGIRHSQDIRNSIANRLQKVK
jgi:hypothetical protein